MAEARRAPARPPWLTKRLPLEAASQVPELLEDLRLNTVCRSAKCPNLGECWARGTATFMILGNTCTRGCRFCAIDPGPPCPPDPGEPERVAVAARRLGLRFVVVTSVTRDDLEDGGAHHFAAAVAAIHRIAEARVEVLVPDFQGEATAIDAVVASGCEVFGHNLETVPRLYPEVRPGAEFERSLRVLRRAAEAGGERMLIKSGLMLGLGERPDEVADVLGEMRRAGCRAVTLGQYLCPRPDLVPVAEYVEPVRFDEYAALARELGFTAVLSGPFVRSSYMAEHVWGETCGPGGRPG